MVDYCRLVDLEPKLAAQGYRKKRKRKLQKFDEKNNVFYNLWFEEKGDKITGCLASISDRTFIDFISESQLAISYSYDEFNFFPFSYSLFTGFIETKLSCGSIIDHVNSFEAENFDIYFLYKNIDNVDWKKRSANFDVIKLFYLLSYKPGSPEAIAHLNAMERKGNFERSFAAEYKLYFQEWASPRGAS